MVDRFGCNINGPNNALLKLNEEKTEGEPRIIARVDSINALLFS